MMLKEHWDWFRRAPILRFVLWLVSGLIWVFGSREGWRLADAIHAGVNVCGEVHDSRKKRKQQCDCVQDDQDVAKTQVFQDKLHEVGLSVALSELQGSKLTLLGRSAPFGRILQKKLCIEAMHRNLKGLPEFQLPKPVWIVSLPRTGSTWFHNLCDVDPQGRTLKAWELRFPIPCTMDCGPSIQERKDHTKKILETLYKVCPQFKKIHYVEYDQPDECVNGFMDCFFPEHWAWGLIEMPNTENTYVGSDMDKQYENYKKLIQTVLYQEVLENKNNKEEKIAFYDKLVLKSPHHIYKLREIARVFPGSTFIWLHRDLDNVVGSCCSMNQNILDQVSPTYFDLHREVGKPTLKHLAAAVEKGLKDRAFLEQNGKDVKFVDIFYQDLKKDPIHTMKMAFKEARLPFSEAFEAKLEVKLRSKKQTPPQHESAKRKTNEHQYSLESYGIDRKEIENAFKQYIEAYPRLIKKKT